jgi:membrane-anchored glycerophosphoryl diester phosphodiesterase (GDPDase)
MNNQPFKFSITDAVRYAWTMFKGNPWLYAGLAFLAVVFNLNQNMFEHHIVVDILLIFCAVVWGYVWLSVGLATIDQKREVLTFKTLRTHLPSFRQLFTFIITSIVSGILTLVGFILLIIPGFYVAVRLWFTNMTLVDKKEGIEASIRYSWDLVKGGVFWTVFLTMITCGVLMLVGVILFGVGVLVTYPLTLLIMAKLYRDLEAHHKASTSIVEQPAELTS